MYDKKDRTIIISVSPFRTLEKDWATQKSRPTSDLGGFALTLKRVGKTKQTLAQKIIVSMLVSRYRC